MVKGAVLSLLADTQAAHSIGGYKIGVGFALRKCRGCLATKDSLSTMVRVYALIIKETLARVPCTHCG